MKEKVSKKFGELYGSGAILFASPGRINLIGEHTDYNGGFVFPGAVDKGIVAAIKLNGTDKVRAYALDLGESAEFRLDEADKPAQSWACYIFGVCREIQKRGWQDRRLRYGIRGRRSAGRRHVFVGGARIDLRFRAERSLQLRDRQI